MYQSLRWLHQKVLLSRLLENLQDNKAGLYPRILLSTLQEAARLFLQMLLIHLLLQVLTYKALVQLLYHNP